MNYSKFLVIFFTLILMSFGIWADEYSAGNDFVLNVGSLNKHIFSNNMNSDFEFNITNTLPVKQNFKIITDNVSGWDIILDENNFVLSPKETKLIKIKFKANNEFDYSTNVLSSDTIKIVQKNDYNGDFSFPILISGKDENITLKYELNIDKFVLEPNYNIQISTEDLSPISPLKFTIQSENLNKKQNVEILVKINGKEYYSINREFSKDNYYQIFSFPIDLKLDPGTYTFEVLLRVPIKENVIKEWKKDVKLNIVPYEKLKIKETKFESYFKDVYIFNISNLGNTNTYFEKNITFNFFKGLFFSSNNNYVKTDNGARIKINLKKGENVVVDYYFNYISLYIIFLILFLISANIYIKRNSNPLLIDTKLYDINKVKFEGIKSFKVRIGFENIKENEIEDIKLIFRMPSYLSIKEDSFLLSEPNHVLKGKSQYKLIWDFKRFEKSDSRILGFTLENKRGILGDIKIPDLEFEVKIKGKVKKYYKSFPVIRG